MTSNNLSSIYDFHCPGLTGKMLDLSQWRGQPLLIVNTASRCGFATQYTGLQKLWQELKESGLVILGVPSNDFGQQEPGNSEEIQQFCDVHYGVSFPLTEKSSVRGANAIPLFKFLAKEGGYLSRPRWNFYKYLINREGHLAEWFTPLTAPDSLRLVKAVEKVL